MNDTKLKRAGLDYHEYASLVIHENWKNCRRYFANRPLWAIETSGEKYYHQVNYTTDAVLLFGSETKGLPSSILTEIGPESVVRLPMLVNQRSLNLSNSVAIAVYEAWRQLEFYCGV